MKQNILEMALLFLTFFLPGMLFPASGLERADAAPGRFMVEAVLSALPQVLLLLYVLWLRDRPSEDAPAAEDASPPGRSPWSRFGLVRPRPGDLLQGVIVFAGATALLVSVNLAFSLLPIDGHELLEDGFRFRLDDWRLIPLALVFGIVTGYREELFFRGYLITRFAEIGAPGYAAVAASCLLFASGHLYQGPTGFVTALALGALFGVLFLRRRNLHRLAVAHALYNTMVLAASLWAKGP